MIKAVIFDMNGVIIDDEDIHEIAFKSALDKYNAHFNHEDYLKIFGGRTDEEGIEVLAKKLGRNDIPTDKVTQEKQKQYFNLFPQNKKTFKGVVGLVKSLSKQYKLALTTSATKKEANMILKEFNLTDYFPTVITSNDITRGKPDPQPYLLTAEKLNLNPSDCIVIEDSGNGVLSAKAAGMKCIGVTTTHPKKAVEMADKVVESFSEINNILINSL